MILQRLALVSIVPKLVKIREVAKVASALQTQVMRDFAQFWGIQATVDAFEELKDVPLGHWPIIIQEKVDGAAGIHLDDEGQPFALVEAGEQWPLTASHECLEMLADPFGNRLQSGPSIHPNQENEVRYLVEVSDPSEAFKFGYEINGFQLSDFYTPNYFDIKRADGVRYSFTRSIEEPRQVLEDGYISWHDPVSNDWWQYIRIGGDEYVNLGKLDFAAKSLRTFTDQKIIGKKRSVLWVPFPQAATPLAAARTPSSLQNKLTQQVSNSRAESWTRQIEELNAQVRKIMNPQPIEPTPS